MFIKMNISSKKSKAIALGVLISLILVIIVEFSLVLKEILFPSQANIIHQINKLPIQDQTAQTTIISSFDNISNDLKRTPFAILLDTYINNDKTIWKVKYSIDKYGRRTTPIQDKNTRKKFAIFFGCSWIFGLGLNDDQTLPYYFSQLAGEYTSYNYGISGGGPSQMMSLIESNNIPNEVAQKEGIAIFSFSGGPAGSVSRTVGSSLYINHLQNTAYYDFNSQGRIVKKGTFKKEKPLQTWIFKKWNQLKLTKNFSLPIINNSHLRLTCQIIKKSKQLFQKQFPKSNFYVLFHGIGYNPQYSIQSCLKKLDIHTINHQHLASLPGLTIPGDGHPSPLGNLTVAKQLLKDLHL